MYMPSLNFLHLGENNITVDLPLNKKSLPNIVDLYLNGNNLQSFPSKSLKDNLSYLGIARCDLKSLPLYLSEFKNLKYLDARDNAIVKVDDDLKELIEGNDVESYFSISQPQPRDQTCYSGRELDRSLSLLCCRRVR